MYLLEVGIGEAWFSRRRRLFTMGDGDTVESSVDFEIEGETWSEDKSSGTIFANGLLVRD